MSYKTIAAITQSGSLINRLTAAAAEQSAPGDYGSWVYARIWDYAAMPGWAAKWESALAAGVTDPGDNESVITDGDILSATQALLAAPVPPEEPEA